MTARAAELALAAANLLAEAEHVARAEGHEEEAWLLKECWRVAWTATRSLNEGAALVRLTPGTDEAETTPQVHP